VVDLQRTRSELPENSEITDQGQQALDQWMLSAQKMRPAIEIQTPEEILGDLLTSLKIDIPEIQATLIVSIEGSILASKQFDGSNERIIEAMTAALVSVAEQASLELDKGEPTEFIIRSTQGLIYIKRLSEVHLLVILTQRGVRLELLEDAVNQVIPKIRQHLF
jgi:predicted regulator of Ras-like GTPase activity (Roadblock/LC7/MglB family)